MIASLVRISLSALALATLTAGFHAQRTQTATDTPPIRPTVRTGRPVLPPPVTSRGMTKAVVVRSWAGGTASGWSDLNVEWPNYGSAPIVIDTATLGAAGSFTYDDLVATGADVVILSDPAGGQEQYSQDEVDALAQYVQEGHNLIGTYQVFAWGVVDNSALAPLFGLRTDVTYGSNNSINNVFAPLVENRLFRGLNMRPWNSSGYAFSDLPTPLGAWYDVDHPGARVIAAGDAGRSAVTLYRAPAYHAIFFSNMPEYFGNAIDKQLLYNAIVYPVPSAARANSSARTRVASKRR